MLVKFICTFIAISIHLEALISEKVIICVVCRDVSEYIPSMISQLEGIGSLFQDYKIFAYEYNSDDDTPSQLYRWKRSNSKVTLKVEYINDYQLQEFIINKKAGAISRLELNGLARNKVLSLSLDNSSEDFSYVICVEPTTQVLTLDAFEEIFRKSDMWDAVFAYGEDKQGKFNDWEAFRNATYPCGPELLGSSWNQTLKGFSLNSNDPWVPVCSAYGGCAIYKRNALRDCKYNGLITEELEIVTRKLLSANRVNNNPQVIQYEKALKRMKRRVYISSPHTNLPQLPDSYGVYINSDPSHIIWNMQGLSDRYPAVCEHVTLHASMYYHGYTRLYINPRLVCVEKVQ